MSSPRVRYATVRRRLAAFAVDYVAISAYIALLLVAGLFLGGEAGAWEAAWTDPLRGRILGFAVLTFPVLAYFALFESSNAGATPGKRLLGIRVSSRDGGRLPLPRGFVRSAVKLLPWEATHAALRLIPGWPADVEGLPATAALLLAAVWLLVVLYLVVPILHPDRRAPYDLAAGSIVVRERQTVAS